MPGAAAGALLEAGDLLWCPCFAVEVPFQVALVLLSMSVGRSSGHGDAREALGSFRATQGRLCHARRADVGMAELLLGSSWQSWVPGRAPRQLPSPCGIYV